MSSALETQGQGVGIRLAVVVRVQIVIDIGGIIAVCSYGDAAALILVGDYKTILTGCGIGDSIVYFR